MNGKLPVSLLVAIFLCGYSIAHPATPAVLLHNQWPIRPVGRQIDLGVFPVNLAIQPSGRYGAVLHAGRTGAEIRLVDLVDGRVTQIVPMHETFYGLAFTPNGQNLIASGGTDAVLHVYSFHDGRLDLQKDIKVPAPDSFSAVAGLVTDPREPVAYTTTIFESRVIALDLNSGATCWSTELDPPGATPEPRWREGDFRSNTGLLDLRPLVDNADPLGLACDGKRHRIYVSLWGQSAVAVLDSGTGRVLARWPAGLHPNEIVLSRNGKRLFVANGGINSVTAIDTQTGRAIETLNSSFLPGELPGSTPDGLALSSDGRLLFVANADNNNIAVFDLSVPGQGRSLGFIPTGWFPTAVRLTPDGRHLLVLNARGLQPKANNIGETGKFRPIAGLFQGTLGVLDLPRGDALDRAMADWSALAAECRPAPIPPPTTADNPIPLQRGGPTPIRYVIYLIKENRTYDQVLGDLAEGNGDPHLCLFPAKVTPNLHRLAQDFVLLDNFYANAAVSKDGHEWSAGAYASEFVEKVWPVNNDHRQPRLRYPAEGRYAAAVPALGYIWDRAKEAGVSYRDFGEFVMGHGLPEDPSISTLPALAGHVDPLYRGWDLNYSDLDRAARFISVLHQYEAKGEMPRLQILRLPNDHNFAALAGALRPRAMVAQNDLAFGRIIEAVSHSKFWAQTVVFAVEDDAQDAPDHVDAHRTEAMVIGPYVRRHAVDSTPYTTCSMLSTIEYVLGLKPMSQFDDAAWPMRASFQAQANFEPYVALPAQTDLQERNPRNTKAAVTSAHLDFSREDANDELTFNRVIWAAERGDDHIAPAPVHAAFVQPIVSDSDDD